jgi:hypothetical protein
MVKGGRSLTLQFTMNLNPVACGGRFQGAVAAAGAAGPSLDQIAVLK